MRCVHHAIATVYPQSGAFAPTPVTPDADGLPIALYPANANTREQKREVLRMVRLMLKAVAFAACFAMLFLVSVAPRVYAQAVSGDLIGVVEDPSGAVVSGAHVEVTNLDTRQKAAVEANQNGQYRFVNLPVGRYSIQATGTGLSGTLAQVDVQLNKTATANVSVAAGTQTTTVEVTGTTTTIDTTTAQIQNSFETKQMQDLPTASVGFGVLNLSLLNAGVASSGGMGAGTGPSVSGQRPRNNNYTVEGVDNNSKAVTGPMMTVPNDAVENFTVLQNQFTPEFGHSSGAQFNQIVRSGTNQLHGRVYEYLQNRNLNAQDSFTAQSQRAQGISTYNTPFDSNRFGGQVGGPIIKDKLFFFTSQEYNPIHQALSTSACAPTAAGYTLLQGQSTAGQISATNFGAMQTYLPAALTQASAANPQDPCLIGGQPYAVVNGTNIPVGDIGFTGSAYNNTFTSTNAVDWNISDRDQLRFRYIYGHNSALDVGAQLPAFWTSSPTRNHVVTLSEYHTFGATVSNELRLGFNRLYLDLPLPSSSFAGLSEFPNLTIDELNGVNLGPDSSAPQFVIQNTYQLTDNVTWSHGKHNFKFGFEGRKYIAPSHFVQRERGDYFWNTMQDYLTDIAPTDFGERSTGNTDYAADQYALYGYGNDEWRVNQHLTLNLGLRYEFTSVPAGLANQALNSAASVPGLISFNAPTPQKTNFAPRIGFAYSPGTSGNTSIRGGFGIAYDVLYDNIGSTSLPPQLTGTCDVGNQQSATCFYSNSGFLANGGLPQTGAAPVFPTILDQREATSAYVPNQQLPYTITWNFGVQHVFARNYIAEVRYVGTHGIHLPIQTRLNNQSRITASNSLPTYLAAPSQAQLDGLTTTLSDLEAVSGYVPAYAANGFDGNSITAIMPYGHSMYHGLQTQVTRNFLKGLQLQAAWTWSHALDNSTADFFTTLLTPRRPQNFQNVDGDYGTSALDRRHRVTISGIYDLPFLKSSSHWAGRNVFGNWEIAPTYTFQSPEYATVQSAVDSNLNGDSFGDRAILNPTGIAGTGSSVTPLTSSAGATVAYLANDPSAQYITAGLGAWATAPRNTLALPRTNNWDVSVVKRVSFSDRYTFEFQAQALNVFNHSQYVPGSLNQINSIGFTAGAVRDFLTPGKSAFDQPNLVFSQNGRTMSLVAKFSF